MVEEGAETRFHADPEPGFNKLVVHRHRDVPAPVAVVFIHGLGGTRYGTWGNLPAYLFAETSGVDILLYAYRTAFKRLFTRESFDLKTQCKILADELTILGYSGYILVGHSMGGLVCKGVVYELHSSNTGLVKKILGLILLASPQLGTSRLPRFFTWLNKDARALRLFNPFVAEVTTFFQNFVWTWERPEQTGETAGPLYHIPIYAVISASDLWVDKMSAGYGLPAGQKMTLAASHTKLVKPASVSDYAYQLVKKHIESCLIRFESLKAQAGETADEAMVKYKHQVSILRGSYESHRRDGRERVREEGPALAETIDNLDDRRLTNLRRVFKYEYGGWLETLIARCTDDRSVSVARARRGIEKLEYALNLIGELEKKHKGGIPGDEGSAYEYILQVSHDQDRSRYLLAIAKNLLGELGVEGFRREDVLQCLESIRKEYLEKNPAEEERALRWTFSTSAQEIQPANKERLPDETK